MHIIHVLCRFFSVCKTMNPGIKISGRNALTLRDVSPVSCWAMCLARTWDPPCMSVEYDTQDYRCNLSKAHSTDSDVEMGLENNKNLYERCD